MNPVFTIGHSTRMFDEFVSLLQKVDVRTVVDVRSAPTSRKHPQFDGYALSEELSGYQMRYLHLEALGGHRPKSKTALPATNAFWNNQSFHNYADYAMTDSFRAGLDALIELSQKSLTAIMCSEAVWWRCHRRIITDYLLSRGIRVQHILSPKSVQDAQFTPAARPCGDVLSYPV